MQSRGEGVIRQVIFFVICIHLLFSCSRSRSLKSPLCPFSLRRPSSHMTPNIQYSTKFCSMFSFLTHDLAHVLSPLMYALADPETS